MRRFDVTGARRPATSRFPQRCRKGPIGPPKITGKSLPDRGFPSPTEACADRVISAYASARRFVIRCPAREHLCRLFLGSSAVEHSTVNRMVAGSNPARGASKFKHLVDFRRTAKRTVAVCLHVNCLAGRKRLREDGARMSADEDGVIACLTLPRVFPEAGLVRHLPWRTLYRSNCTERSGSMDLYAGIGDAKISSYPINPFAISSEMVFATNVGLSCLSNDHLKFQSVLNALKVFSRKVAVNTVSGSLSLVRHARFSRVSQIIRQRNANHGESRKSQSLAESVSMVGVAIIAEF